MKAAMSPDAPSPIQEIPGMAIAVAKRSLEVSFAVMAPNTRINPTPAQVVG